LAFSPDGKTLLTSGGDGTTRSWDVATAKQTRCWQPTLRKLQGNPKLRAAEMWLRQNAFSPDGKLVASAGLDHVVHVWDVPTGKLLYKFDQAERPQRLVFLPKGGYLVVSDDQGRLRVLEAATGKEQRVLWRRTGQLDEDDPIPFVGALAIAPDGQTLAVAEDFTPYDEGRQINIDYWKVSTATKRTLVEYHVGGLLHDAQLDGGHRIVALAFSPDGKHLAGATPGTVYLFDAATGKEVRIFSGPQIFGRSIAFSPDGKWLAAGKLDGSIRVWDVATGTVLADVPGHELPISSLAFSPDGKLLASASADSTVLLWKVADLVRPTAKVVLSAKDLERLWTELGDADAEKADRAITALIAAPAESVTFLKRRLHPVAPADAAVVEKLLDALDHPKFAVREKATAELDKLAELARPALEKRLAGKLTLEMRKRLEGILLKLDGFETRPEVLRGLRAIEVLEYIGAPQAQQLLEVLATGAAESVVTQQARAALKRLQSPAKAK
jgi:WD40 repeat protein